MKVSERRTRVAGRVGRQHPLLSAGRRRCYLQLRRFTGVFTTMLLRAYANSVDLGAL